MNNLGTVAALGAVLFLAACGGDPVIGKWSDGTNSSIEFMDGGSCVILSGSPGLASCSWQTLSDGWIVLHETAMGMTVTFVGHFEGDDLVIIAPDNKPMPTLHRTN